MRLTGFPFVMAALASMTATGCERTPFTVDLDAGGCRLERIAVEDGVNSYQYDSFSPDGSTLAIAWDRGEEIRGTYFLDLRTGRRVNLPEFNNGATFSPDGHRLINSVYVDGGKTDVAELDMQTGEIGIIAPHEAWDWLPSYSPDGASVVFNSFRTGNSDIYLYDRATQQLRRMTTSDAYEAHAQFSPDGKTLVFHRQIGDGDFNLMLMDVESGAEKQITDAPGEESYPSWAPDGQHLFFSSDRDNEAGKTDVFVMTAGGENVRQLTRNPHKDAYAFASPDGGHLYFTSYREPQGVYRMKIDAHLDCDRSSRQ